MIELYKEFGQEKVFLEAEEIEEIRSLKEIREFTLIGFKDRNCLEWFHNLRSSIFIYPDNDQVSNSSMFSEALIEELISKNKIVICRFKPLEKHVYRFCALIPQKENHKDGKQNSSGFHLLLLPFKDEIKNVEEKFFETLESIFDYVNKKNVAEKPISDVYQKSIQELKKLNKTKDQMHTECDSNKNDLSDFLSLNKKEKLVCTQLIDALSIEQFSPSFFENPAIQIFYNKIQALALEEEAPDAVEDLLQPDQEGLNENQDVIEQFNQVFEINVKKTTK